MSKLLDYCIVMLLVLTTLWLPTSAYLLHNQHYKITTQREVLISTLINIGELQARIDLNDEALLEVIRIVFVGEEVVRDL